MIRMRNAPVMGMMVYWGKNAEKAIWMHNIILKHTVIILILFMNVKLIMGMVVGNGWGFNNHTSSHHQIKNLR